MKLIPLNDKVLVLPAPAESKTPVYFHLKKLVGY